jgi:hypothetical protein
MAGKTHKLHGVDLDCMPDVLIEFHQSTFSRLNTYFNQDLTMLFLGFSNLEGRALRQEISVINSLQHIFKMWVECCKKCIACQRRYFGKETITTPPQSSDSE